MKYIKHMTGAAQDTKMRDLLDETGGAGYAAYWLILEAIGAQLTPQNMRTEMVASDKIWREITRLSPKNLQNFLSFSQEMKLFEISREKKGKNNKSYITIRCPKLLEYSDEYFSKVMRVSGQGPDNVPPRHRLDREETKTRLDGADAPPAAPESGADAPSGQSDPPSGDSPPTPPSAEPNTEQPINAVVVGFTATALQIAEWSRALNLDRGIVAQQVEAWRERYRYGTEHVRKPEAAVLAWLKRYDPQKSSQDVPPPAKPQAFRDFAF